MKKIAIEMSAAFLSFLQERATERTQGQMGALDDIKDKICELFDAVDEPYSGIYVYMDDPGKTLFTDDGRFHANIKWISSIDGQGQPYSFKYHQVSGSMPIICPVCGRENWILFSQLEDGMNMLKCDSDSPDEHNNVGCNAHYCVRLSLKASATVHKIENY